LIHFFLNFHQLIYSFICYQLLNPSLSSEPIFIHIEADSKVFFFLWKSPLYIGLHLMMKLCTTVSFLLETHKGLHTKRQATLIVFIQLETTTQWFSSNLKQHNNFHTIGSNNTRFPWNWKQQHNGFLAFGNNNTIVLM
jgi:hypothetical protein